MEMMLEEDTQNDPRKKKRKSEKHKKMNKERALEARLPLREESSI
jgi:hypothetical protein